MEILKKLGYVLILTAFTIWIGYMIFIFAAIFTNNKKKVNKSKAKTVIVDTTDSVLKSNR